MPNRFAKQTLDTGEQLTQRHYVNTVAMGDVVFRALRPDELATFNSAEPNLLQRKLPDKAVRFAGFLANVGTIIAHAKLGIDPFSGALLGFPANFATQAALRRLPGNRRQRQVNAAFKEVRHVLDPERMVAINYHINVETDRDFARTPIIYGAESVRSVPASTVLACSNGLQGFNVDTSDPESAYGTITPAIFVSGMMRLLQPEDLELWLDASKPALFDIDLVHQHMQGRGARGSNAQELALPMLAGCLSLSATFLELKMQELEPIAKECAAQTPRGDAYQGMQDFVTDLTEPGNLMPWLDLQTAFYEMSRFRQST